MFGWDGAAKAVTMPAEVWRELSLLGHWIVDAVIVRWAALTARFAQRQGLDAGSVLPLLLARPLPERATELARTIYRASGIDRCVWTNQPLGASFHVDHIIPFSLWGNNDFWNLVPVTPAANLRKSGKLPAAALLEARRTALAQAWEATRAAAQSGFDSQAMKLLAPSELQGEMRWPRLFSRLREAVEFTALQRGTERWSP
jgi:hypothetical protein